MQVEVRALGAEDAKQWRVAYRLYAEFYQTAISNEKLSTVWAWLQSGELRGLGAFSADGILVGIAHCALLLRPLQAARICYLHDLLVLPACRGSGVGRCLIAAVADVAQQEGCGLIRWATAADNETAMRLYDKVARKTSWVLYEKETLTKA